MILFKTSANTLRNVLLYAKHASTGRPRTAREGDIILVSQTKGTLRRGQKPIRWIMTYVRTYADMDGESESIWGKHWPYIIEAKNVRSVEPFDIDEIKVTKKDYGSAMSFSVVEPEDKAAVLRWIGEEALAEIDERESAAEEVGDGGKVDLDSLIQMLDEKYAGTPSYDERVVRRIQRPSDLRELILAKYNYTCRICGCEGFEKRGGGRYAEAHHMRELNKQAPHSLQSWNVLVVCPTCHRMLHRANVATTFLNPGWRIEINGKEHFIK